LKNNKTNYSPNTPEIQQRNSTPPSFRTQKHSLQKKYSQTQHAKRENRKTQIKQKRNPGKIEPNKSTLSQQFRGRIWLLAHSMQLLSQKMQKSMQFEKMQSMPESDGRDRCQCFYRYHVGVCCESKWFWVIWGI